MSHYPTHFEDSELIQSFKRERAQPSPKVSARPAATSDQGPAASSRQEKDNLVRLNKSRRAIESRARQDIQFARPLLYYGEVGVIYPNSITVIQGQKGVHKSRLTENFCAAFLRMDAAVDYLGFTVEPLTPFHIVYVDTERNLNDQFPYAIQRIKLLAGLDKKEHPPHLEAVSLLEIERGERFEALTAYLAQVQQQQPDKCVIVVLDVLTDCIGNFNDPKESLRLIDLLNMAMNKYNVSFLCVIHENPSSMGEGKARGHLGTELINKATTVMSIGYEKGANNATIDLIALKFLHTRSSKRPQPHYLRSCEQAKGLVVAHGNFIAEQKDLKNSKASLAELKDWFGKHVFGKKAKSKLLEELMEHFECGSKTIETRLKELSEGDEAFLVRSKEGKEVFYSLRVPF